MEQAPLPNSSSNPVVASCSSSKLNLLMVVRPAGSTLLPRTTVDFLWLKQKTKSTDERRSKTEEANKTDNVTMRVVDELPGAGMSGFDVVLFILTFIKAFPRKLESSLPLEKGRDFL